MNHCSTCLWWLPNRPEFRVPNAGLCLNPKINFMTLAELGCEWHMGQEAVEVNVPQHLKAERREEKAMEETKVDGPVEIMIVSYGTPTRRCSGQVVSDLDWLRYAVRSIQKFCTGFAGLTIVHPNHELAMFHEMLLSAEFGPVPVRLKAFDEIPGKGFLQHEIMLAQADLLVPSGTKYVLLTDSDYVFKEPTRPEDYFRGGVPYYLIRSWDSLTTEDPRNPGSKVISDCAQWRRPTEEQVGFITEVYGMCMNAAVLPIDFFKAYRYHVSFVQQKEFEAYMLEGRNEHPATRMDWTAFGAFAHQHMRERFYWIDVVTSAYPRDRRLGFWSHGGITDEIRQQLEEVLK